MSVLIDLADAVARLINSKPPAPLTEAAGRSYAAWDMVLSESDELRLDVVPVGLVTAELGDRGETIHYVAAVDVGMRYKFAASDKQTTVPFASAMNGRIDPAKIDALVVLMENLIELFQDEENRRLPCYLSATWRSTTVRTVAPGKYLRQDRMFLSIFRMEYDVFIDLPSYEE